MSSPAESSQSFNLEQYLARLTLKPIIHGPYAPPMPPPKARSAMTPLTLRPGGYRRLRLIEPITLDSQATTYFEKMEGVNVEIMRELKLDLQKDIAPTDYPGAFNPYVVNNAVNVVNVLDRFLRRIIETLLVMIDGDMQGWTFQTMHRPRKNVWETQAVDPFVLCHSDPAGTRGAVKLVLLPLGPWEFAPKDFAEFTSMQRFDDTPSNPDDVWARREWVNADRMWAYLYDLCLDFNCPYFVVTSHEQWSFGGFSQYYRTASLTRALPFDNQPISIAEILLYWIHVAFEKDTAMSMHPVCNEQNYSPQSFENERKTHAKRFLCSGFSEIDPDPDDDEMRPTKRQRCDHDTSGPAPPKVHERPEKAIMMRRRKPKRTYYYKLRRAQIAMKRGKYGTKRRTDTSTDSAVSVDLSDAPSDAEPLPDRLIPRRKNAAIQRWRNLVAIIEEHGDVPQTDQIPQRNWVVSPMFNTFTGQWGGDLELVEDRTCPSCGPSSSSTSKCSLSEGPPECKERKEPDFEGLVIHQWF